MMRARKSTSCCGFFVQPVTVNSNASAQNVCRVECMVTQGTAKSLRLAKSINSNTETCIEHVIARRLLTALRKSIASRDPIFRPRECSLFSTVVNSRLHQLRSDLRSWQLA
jgi:hypothetical protein